ncbi:MAG: hypothetical protein Q8K45_00765 [Rubrivivax sp.]|nr:hypothetical protein [Rubrivivax sp.]
MNKRRCLKIAQRIHAGLLAELGQGIDAQRMLADPLYARDVLLVCDALPEGDLAQLAPLFRSAALAADEAAEPAARRTSGFSASRFFSSFFGSSSTLEEPPQPPRTSARSDAGRGRETRK